MRIVESLRALGYTLYVHDGSIRYKCDHASPPAEARDLLLELKRHKAEVLSYLNLSWPAESAECEEKFGQGSARLYPFLDKTVVTPLGLAKLWQVGYERVGVVFFREPSKVRFMSWYDIRPDGAER